MVGAIARQSSMNSDRSGLVIGYREASALRNTLLTCQGEVVRGHKFHYSCLNAPVARENAAYAFTAPGQNEGIVQGNLLSSSLPRSFSSPSLPAQRFVSAGRGL